MGMGMGGSFRLFLSIVINHNNLQQFMFSI